MLGCIDEIGKDIRNLPPQVLPIALDKLWTGKNRTMPQPY
jgi:hypothetical protein